MGLPSRNPMDLSQPFDETSEKTSSFPSRSLLDEVFRPTEIKEKPLPQASPLEVLSTAGEAVVRIPLQIAGAVAGAIRGGEPEAVTNKRSFLSRIIDTANADAEEFQKKYADRKAVIIPFLPDITTETVSRFPQQAGFSLVSSVAGIGAGLGTAMLTGPTAPIAGRAAGMAAMGGTAYRMTKDQKTQELYQKLNQASLQASGRELSPEEWKKAYEKNEGALVEHGIAEAIPEAIGNLMGFELFFGAAKNVFGKQLAKSAIGKTLDKYGAGAVGKLLAEQATEQSTETWTQQWQHNIDVEMGLAPGETKRSWTSFDDLRKSNREVFADVLLLSSVMGGAGLAGGHVMEKAATNKSIQLVKDVVAENKFNDIPNEFLPAMYEYAQTLSDKRPNDGELVDVRDAFAGEMNRRGIDFDMSSRFKEYLALNQTLALGNGTGEDVARWTSLRDEFKERNINPDLYQGYLTYQADIRKATALHKDMSRGTSTPEQRREFNQLVDSIASRATVFGFAEEDLQAKTGVEKGGIVRKPMEPAESAARDVLLGDEPKAKRANLTAKEVLTEGDIDIQSEEDLTPENLAAIDRKLTHGLTPAEAVDSEEVPVATVDITGELKDGDQELFAQWDTQDTGAPAFIRKKVERLFSEGGGQAVLDEYGADDKVSAYARYRLGLLEKPTPEVRSEEPPAQPELTVEQLDNRIKNLSKREKSLITQIGKATDEESKAKLNDRLIDLQEKIQANRDQRDRLIGVTDVFPEASTEKTTREIEPTAQPIEENIVTPTQETKVAETAQNRPYRGPSLEEEEFSDREGESGLASPVGGREEEPGNVSVGEGSEGQASRDRVLEGQEGPNEEETVVTPATESKAVEEPQKEHWEMTREEYLARNPDSVASDYLVNPRYESDRLGALQKHKGIVYRALRAGKPVPERVQAEYPEFLEKFVKKVEEKGPSVTERPKELPALTYEEFAKQYSDAFKQSNKYSPDQVGLRHFTDKMGELADQYPEYLERFEKEEEAKSKPKEKPTSEFVKSVDGAINQRAREDLLAKEGMKRVPGIRLQEAEEAGRWAYQVDKGETTQAEFDKWVAQMEKEGRRRKPEEKAPTTPPAPKESPAPRKVTWTDSKGNEHTGTVTKEAKVNLHVKDDSGKIYIIKKAKVKEWRAGTEEPATTETSEEKIGSAPEDEPIVVEKPPGKKPKVRTKISPKEAGKLTPKEQKQYLLAEIDAAIKKLGKEEEGPGRKVEKKKVTIKPYIEGVKSLYKKEYEAEVGIELENAIDIEVPGDGTFTVANSKTALNQFKKSVESGFPTTSSQPTGPTHLPKQASGKARGQRIEQEDVSYYNDFQPRKASVKDIKPNNKGAHDFEVTKDGFFGNGFLYVKTATAPKEAEINDDLSIEEHVKSKDSKPVVFVGEFHNGIVEKNNTNPAKAHFIAKDGSEAFANAHYVDIVLSEHPDAKPFITDDYHPILFKKDGEIVGIVQPMVFPNDESVSKLYADRIEELTGKHSHHPGTQTVGDKVFLKGRQSGSIDLGTIGEEIIEKSKGRFKPGPIRVEEEHANSHIKEERIKKFREEGYADHIDALEDIARHYSSIYEQPNGRLLLVRTNGRKKYGIIELRYHEGEGYYGATTWFIDDARSTQKPYEERGNRKLLMNVARSADSVLSAPFPAGDTEGQVAGSRRSGVSSINNKIEPSGGEVNTEDVGEELTYNKRNRIRTGIKWEDIADKNMALKVKETTKQNVYPRPDYAQMIDDGTPPIIAHIYKQVYDAIAAKPSMARDPSDADLQRYIDAVNKVMGGLNKWIANEDTIARWAADNAKIASAMLGQRVSIMDMANTANTLLEAVYPDGWRNHKDEIRILGGNKLLRALQPGVEDAKRALKDIDSGWPEKRESWQKRGWNVFPSESVTIEERYGYDQGQKTPDFTLDINGTSYHRTLHREEAEKAKQELKPWLLLDKYNRIRGQFDSKEEAEEAAREKVKRQSKDRVSDKGTSVQAATRTGEARRMEGEDISSERLQETFGFRGINFGNWLKGDSNRAERQLHLNHAYDSFMDLAEILGLPPDAMSLNGMLGLAIGAQGTGQYAAHFVPGVNEINLTRTSGAGSLAHEFAHAVDHYFARLGGLSSNKEPFLSEHTHSVNDDGYIKRNNQNVNAFDEALRPEISAKFKAIVKAMNKRPLTQEEIAASNDFNRSNAKKQTERWLAAIRRDFESIGGSQDAKEARIAEIKSELNRLQNTYEKKLKKFSSSAIVPPAIKSDALNSITKLMDKLETELFQLESDILAEFDKLSKRVLDLDLGDGHVVVGRTYLSPVVSEIRELFKEESGRALSIDDIKALQSNIDHYAYLNSERAAERDHAPQTTTEYAKNALKLDKEKGGKRYWSTNVEKFARAFDAFVSDTLEERAAKNTYLSHAGRTGETVPMGEERKMINDAFAGLISEFKTKEEDGRTVLFSLKNKKPWPEDFPKAYAQTHPGKISRHPDHEAAKAGDVDAAIRLVNDLVKLERVDEIGRLYPNAKLVAVHAVEESGKNAIPQTYAEAISHRTGLPVDDDIVQTNVAGHSKKKGLERILSRATFDGPVDQGQEYIIVDDLLTQGGTVSELRHYIENNGGRVVAVTSLGFSTGSNVIAVKPENVVRLVNKFGRKELESVLKENDIAVSVEALTNSEALYLLSYSNLDTLRDRIAQAKQEGSERQGFSLLPEAEGRETSEAGVNQQDITNHLSPIINNLSVGPEGGVKIVQSQKELPQRIQGQAKDRSIEGCYDPQTKTVWLVADNLNSLDHAEEVFAEEVYLHHGLAAILGEQKANAFLREVVAYYGKDGLRDIAEDRGFDLLTPAGRLRAAEEKLGEIVQSGERPGLVKRIVAAVREALRAMGFQTKFDDADIHRMLAKVRRGVEGNRDQSDGQGVISESINQFAQNVSMSLKAATKSITDNPNFMKWFGDSKVVDKNGKPLVVYHGTPYGSFDERAKSINTMREQMLSDYEIKYKEYRDHYDVVRELERELWEKYGNMTSYTNEFSVLRDISREKRAPDRSNIPPLEEEGDIFRYVGTNDPGYLGRGFYFSANKSISDLWAKYAARGKIPGEFEAPYVYSVFLKIENPWYEETGEMTKEMADRRQEIYKRLNSGNKDIDRMQMNHATAKTLMLKEFGYDGIIGESAGKQGVEYVVFSPTQIKSIWNQGTFDESNPDIMFSLPPSEEATSLFPEVDKRLRAAKGIQYASLKERTRDALVTTWEHFTRHFQHLDPKTDGAVIDVFRTFQDVPAWAKDETVRQLTSFIGKLSTENRQVFTMNILLPDMLRDIDSGLLELEEGKELPFGYKNRDQVQQDYDHFKQLAEQRPDIAEALRKRNAYMGDLTKQLIEHKLLKKELQNRPGEYFHHQVLAYMNYKANPNWGISSQDVRTHRKGWEIGRKGSALDYNTEYLESEFEVLSQALAQIETVKTLKKIERLADIKPDLEAEARSRNMATFVQKVNLAAGDPLKPFRIRIAMGMIRLGKLAEKGAIYAPEQYDDVIEFLVEQARRRQEAIENDEEFYPERHPQMFGLLSYLVNHPSEASMPAAMIFKAIAGRNALIKEVVGKDWVTFKDLMPEGYVVHKPDSRSTFYFTNSISDQALEQVLAGNKLLPDAIRKVLARGRDTEWVVKEGISKTLNEFRPQVNQSMVERISGDMLTTWKQWILMNPFRVIKYNVNNMSGDLDIAMAYDPKIITGYFAQAFRDLRAASAGKASEQIMDELSDLTRRGVVGSGMTMIDIPELNDVKAVKDLVDFFDGKSKNFFSKWYARNRQLSTLRENILRLAAHRYFRDRLAKNERVYGASRKSEVDAMDDINDKAAKLARELIGDYGNISHAGQYIRKQIIPFFSWMEINAPRYVRLFQNVKHETGSGGYASIGGTIAWKATKLGIKATALMGMVILWNAAFFPDEEKELQETGREQLHLILGRRSDGSIITLRFQGALSDALSWFGMSNPLEQYRAAVSGRKSAGNLAGDVVKAPVLKLFQGVRPEPKMVYETVSGESFYPDPTRPRPIRDTTQHILRTFSLDKLYNLAAGKPRQGGSWASQMIRDIEGMVLYEADPGEQAYYTARKYVFDWLGKHGKEQPAIIPTNKSNALYYYRQALKFGDFDAAERYLKKYRDMGGKLQDLQESIKRVHPLGSLRLDDRHKFRASLSSEQNETLMAAIDWYKKHYVENYRDQRKASTAP